MSGSFDIGAKVKVKESSSKYPSGTGIILKLGMIGVKALDDLNQSETSWVVELGGTREDILERDLELISESEI